jgi:hypothetical protein
MEYAFVILAPVVLPVIVGWMYANFMGQGRWDLLANDPNSEWFREEKILD